MFYIVLGRYMSVPWFRVFSADTCLVFIYDGHDLHNLDDVDDVVVDVVDVAAWEPYDHKDRYIILTILVVICPRGARISYLTY